MDNCLLVTQRILYLLKIKYTSKYLKDNILSHPDYPSLLSIKNTLEKYNIESLAVKIAADKLKEMPLPCVVQIGEDHNSSFLVLKEVLEDGVVLYNNKNKLLKKTKEDFFKMWTGVCLLVETSEKSKEIGIEKKLRDKRIINIMKGGITLLLAIWIVITLFKSKTITDPYSTFLTIAYCMLKIIGLIIGALLLWFDIDKYNPTLQNFCSGGSKKINCNSVLTSKYSKMFGRTLSLSILGFSYFFATLFYLVINNFSSSAVAVSNICSLVTIPIVLTSIYYQAIVIKQWCKFCIIIQAVLVGEALIAVFGQYYNLTTSLETLPLLLALLIIPILVWKVIKPILEQAEEKNLYKRLHKKIKNNPDVLEGLLVKSRKVKTNPTGLGIAIDNKSAKYNVVKVCNPYCGPCATVHPILEELVNAEKINLQILFTAKIDANDVKVKPVKHFLAIDAHSGKKKMDQVKNLGTS